MHLKLLFSLTLLLKLNPAHGACDGLIKNSVLLESARQVQLPALDALKSKEIEESLKLLKQDQILIKELFNLEKKSLPEILEAQFYQDTQTIKELHLKLKELATDEQHKTALDSIESQLNKILENTNSEVLAKDVTKMIEDFKTTSAGINTENSLRFGSTDLEAIHQAISTEL
ncbi:MAG: hypothetical protein JNM93_11665, partial [Bacteriovoracaceae bacterium]|nr:hypothetical protein [Bacteriovoracaceae bacterium]